MAPKKKNSSSSTTKSKMGSFFENQIRVNEEKKQKVLKENDKNI